MGPLDIRRILSLDLGLCSFLAVACLSLADHCLLHSLPVLGVVHGSRHSRAHWHCLPILWGPGNKHAQVAVPLAVPIRTILLQVAYAAPRCRDAVGPPV